MLERLSIVKKKFLKNVLFYSSERILMAEGVGFRPTDGVTAPPADLQSVPLSRSGIPPQSVASSSGLRPWIAGL